MSLMGIGSCLLGYNDPDVTEAVVRRVQAGSMCTLNSPEEVELAELLVRLHPWADNVRFARTGGEAMAVAVRIARARTGRDLVAICGYHGWHDWYLAANLAPRRAAIGRHLLPGLSPRGVPSQLAGTALPFTYNDSTTSRRSSTDTARLAAVVMEPTRSDHPAPGIPRRRARLVRRAGAVRVFDEITTGWRFTLGGAHLRYGVEPDVAVFAKALGNGHPMAAVIGRPEVMQAAQESFISSTYWTEGVGPAAALATIRKMQRFDVPGHIAKIGTSVAEGLRHAVPGGSLPEPLGEAGADLLDVAGQVDGLHLADRGQRGGRADAFGPVGARNERLLGGLHHLAAADDRGDRMTVAEGLGEHGDVGLDAVAKVGSAQSETPAGRDLVEHQTAPARWHKSRTPSRKPGSGSSDRVGSMTTAASRSPWRSTIAESSSSRLYVNGSVVPASCDGTPRGSKPGQQVAVEPPPVVLGGEIRGQVPVVPAVVAADGHEVAAGARPGDPHGDGHGLAAGPGEADVFGPGVQPDEQPGQFDLLGIVERTHRTVLDAADHGGGHVGVGVAQRAAPDAHARHVDEPAALDVDDFAAPRFAVVGRPSFGGVHFRPLAQELRPAGNQRLGQPVQRLGVLVRRGRGGG